MVITSFQKDWAEYKKTVDYKIGVEALTAKGLKQPYIDNILQRPFSFNWTDKNSAVDPGEILNLEHNHKVLFLRAINVCPTFKEARQKLGLPEKTFYNWKKRFRINRDKKTGVYYSKTK